MAKQHPKSRVEQLRNLAACNKLLQEERRILNQELAKHQKRVRARVKAGRLATQDEVAEDLRWFQTQSALRKNHRADLQAWALKRLNRWTKLNDVDLHFRKWAPKQPGEDRDEYANRLACACMYEYARHDFQLRGLLLVVRMNLGHSFGGLTDEVAERQLGPWFTMLRRLATELAQNLPWSRVDTERWRRALFLVPKGKAVPRPASPIGEYYLGIPPVSTALAMDAAGVTAAEAMPPLAAIREQSNEPEACNEAPSRALCDGVEFVAMRVNWADSSNQELGAEFADWARRNRPAEVPEPNRKKTAWRADVSRRLLDALTVWRLIRIGEKSKGDAARFLAEHGCNTFANGGDEANTGKLLAEAKGFFGRWFRGGPQEVKVRKSD